MFDPNISSKKEMPMMGITGLGGGPGGLQFAGGGSVINDDPLLSSTGLVFRGFDSGGNDLTGYLGPSKTDLRSVYKNSYSWDSSWVDDDNYFNTTSTGIQVWYAPITASYNFLMESPTHHNTSTTGWKLEFDYTLQEGDRVFILPGQRCYPFTDGNTSWGGNGGTFVVVGNKNEANLDTDLLARNPSDALGVCGGAANSTGTVGNATAPGSHPSGSDLESYYSNGSGRSISNYHGSDPNNSAGPSGGAGFLKGSCEHDDYSNIIHVYTDKQDSTSYLFDADPFVRGGRGGQGYVNNQAVQQSLSGLYGSGGFGGGGGQSTGNSYSSGAGGMMGGTENDGSNNVYPSNFNYANGVARIGGGSSYLNGSITATTSQASGTSYGYVRIKYT
tara:strand:- start:2164 stop:3327 length:1164 start_codon:yes stop_codon:yes gene_type:complete